uniref:Uncharacterized protein n=1 Tax=Panagrolaimus sp. JU765 TaxID=591449 RepID=A0AC34PWC6_9BILA
MKVFALIVFTILAAGFEGESVGGGGFKVPSDELMNIDTTTTPPDDQSATSPIQSTTAPSDDRSTTAPIQSTTAPSDDQSTDLPIQTTTSPSDDQSAPAPILTTITAPEIKTTAEPKIPTATTTASGLIPTVIVPKEKSAGISNFKIHCLFMLFFQAILRIADEYDLTFSAIIDRPYLDPGIFG